MEKRYDALDGIRVIAMIGILVMHVLANIPYKNELNGIFLYIKHLGSFTSLFMIVSAFSISCGYYKKMQENWNNIERFYLKRYSKILPFFTFITLIDIVLHFSQENIYEGFANTTLVFGLIPHESITVIGVGWTLGVIFLFYLLYPFVIFLMQNKIRFYISLIVTFIYAFIVNDYFGLGKVDFLFCACYFLGGCWLYLYKDLIQKKCNRIVLFVMLPILVYLYYYCAFNCEYALNYIRYILFINIMMYAIVASDKKTILSTKVMKFLSSISLEIYLCHMVIYRIVEKANLLRVTKNLLFSYIFACILTFIGSIMFAIMFKKIYEIIRMRIKKRKK